MPAPLTYPGVYVEEVPSSVRTITGVGTSVTAFVGFTPRGAIDTPIQLFNIGDFERQFGGMNRDSEISYAVQQFFLNGGNEAWVVRVADNALKASLTVQNMASTAISVLDMSATSEGMWGNFLRVDVDYSTSNPDSTFNLQITEYVSNGTQLLAKRSETHRNLSMDSTSAQYAVSTINTSSAMLKVTRNAAVTSAVLKGLSSGWSKSGDLSSFDFKQLDAGHLQIAISVNGAPASVIKLFDPASPPTSLADLAKAILPQVKAIKPGDPAYDKFSVSVVKGTLVFEAGSTGDATQERSSVRIASAPSLDVAKLLRLGLANGGREAEAAAALRPAPNGNVSVDLTTVSTASLPTKDVTMKVTTAVASVSATFSLATSKVAYTEAEYAELASTLEQQIRAASPLPPFSQATVRLVGKTLQIVSGVETTDAVINFTDAAPGLVAALGLNTNSNVQRYSVGVGTALGQQKAGSPGQDGTAPTALQVIGSLGKKTGLHALEDVGLFNLLCIPRTADMSETDGLAVIAAATAYCKGRRAFFLVDPPATRTAISGTTNGILDWATKSLTPDRNSALYWPNVLVPDPLDNFRLRSLPPSGTVAGLFARVDSTRGPWKAPAGTEASLVNVQGLAYNVTDNENGVLNPVAINCLRAMPVYGRIVWGARTTRGADQLADEYKYIPIRRLALYIEESLYRGTQWVVFEPNDEPLWSQIRLNITTFMHSLFRQGAFQGQSPREAFLVKCDRETTTQADINRGVVNIVVGFAPLKPAEFVIIQLQQLAGQLEA